MSLAQLFCSICIAQVRGTKIGATKKVRDVFSACLRIDVPRDPANSSNADGHVKLVMCFVEVGDITRFLRRFRLTHS